MYNFYDTYNNLANLSLHCVTEHNKRSIISNVLDKIKY